MGGMNRAVLYALFAAALFGASTPLAKRLIGEISPVLMGGLLYLGSGVGLGVARLLRDGGWRASGLGKGEWPWLVQRRCRDRADRPSGRGKFLLLNALQGVC